MDKELAWRKYKSWLIAHNICPADLIPIARDAFVAGYDTGKVEGFNEGQLHVAAARNKFAEEMNSELLPTT